MDPWLEDDWEGVHTRLVTYACDQLQDQLGGGLIARLEKRVYVETEFEEPRQYVPDVHVYDRGRRPPRRAAAGGVAVAEPEILSLPPPEVREAYIEIRDHKAREKLVTVIELVSPVNKRGVVGRRQYQQKQRDVMRADVNLVEIDLLRGGRAVTLARTRADGGAFAAPYHVSTYRAARPSTVAHVPIPLRQRLPAVGVPLRAKDADVALDLQPLVDRTYRNGRYDDVLDYGRPPVPPLAAADAAWAKRLVAAWRRRRTA